MERLERDQQHEAAVAALHEVLETYTDVTRFPKCGRLLLPGCQGSLLLLLW